MTIHVKLIQPITTHGIRKDDHLSSMKLDDLKVNQDELKEFIEEEAKKYKDPKQFETWVYNQPNQLDQYRMIVLENKLVEKLDNDLKSKDKVINFKDLSKY